MADECLKNKRIGKGKGDGEFLNSNWKMVTGIFIIRTSAGPEKNVLIKL